jgi:hypothetical protein
VKLKKFEDYSKAFSKDPKNFEKKVTFASPKSNSLDVFEKIGSVFDLSKSPHGNPIILWDGFSFEKAALNEGHHFFNKKGLPSSQEILTRFKDEKFVPRSTSERSKIKELKFPIIGSTSTDSHEFKTYGKFKKSEKEFDRFSEKITPRTRFDVLVFREKPIHVEEKINKLGFDVYLRDFEYISEIEAISEKIKKEYSPDFYRIRLLEANDSLYLESVDCSSELSPSQGLKMYETAYEDAYVSKLPNWFRAALFEKHVAPYYKKRAYDSLLIKPKHSIDFKKYLNP